MNADWYCRIAGQDTGPHSSATIAEMAGNGRLRPTDFVRKATSDNWAPAAAIKGLTFSGQDESTPLRPPPPPPPPTLPSSLPPPPPISTARRTPIPQASAKTGKSIGHWIMVGAAGLFTLMVIGMLIQMIPAAWHQAQVLSSSFTASQLQTALVGKYEDVPGQQASISLSFQYPKYVRHMRDGSADVHGTFEVKDDHSTLEASGLRGTGALAIVMQMNATREQYVLLVKPILTESKQLIGIQAVGIFDQPLPKEEQVTLLYAGIADLSGTRNTVP